MTMTRWAALAMFAVANVAGATTDTSPAAKIKAEYQRSVVYIEVQANQNGGGPVKFTGTGFFVTRSGYIVTACHVIPDARKFSNIEIHVNIGSSKVTPFVKVEPIRTCDPTLDVGLLKFPEGTGMQFKPIPVGTVDEVPDGATIISLGFPLGDDLTPHTGTLGHKNGVNGRWQTDIKMNEGDSGGPVFDQNGTLIGVALGGEIDNATNAPLDQNYFVPIQAVKPLLTGLPDNPVATDEELAAAMKSIYDEMESQGAIEFAVRYNDSDASPSTSSKADTARPVSSFAAPPKGNETQQYRVEFRPIRLISHAGDVRELCTLAYHVSVSTRAAGQLLSASSKSNEPKQPVEQFRMFRLATDVTKVTVLPMSNWMDQYLASHGRPTWYTKVMPSLLAIRLHGARAFAFVGAGNSAGADFQIGDVPNLDSVLLFLDAESAVDVGKNLQFAIDTCAAQSPTD